MATPTSVYVLFCGDFAGPFGVPRLGYGSDQMTRMLEEIMPTFWMFHTPFVKVQHQFGTDHIQKLSKSLTGMGTPLSETPTLTMPDNEAIHEEYHVPMTADGLVITNLILVEPKIVFPMKIELVYLTPETPATKYRWRITECIIAHLCSSCLSLGVWV